MYARPAGMSDDDDENDTLEYNKNIPCVNKNAKQYKQYLPKSSMRARATEYNRYESRDGFDEMHEIEMCVINACKTGDLEYIKEYLMSHNVNNFLHTGWTLLLYAASFAQTEVIRILLQNEADPNKHKDGYTPLMALCNCTLRTVQERLICLKLFIEAKVNVNATDKRRETAFMYACRSQESEFISEIIKYVKNVNAYDSERKTALFYAVIGNKPETVKILLENLADVTLTDRNDLTVKDVADMKGYTEILSLLNTDEDETTPADNVFKTYDWKMMFPILAEKDDKTLNYDVSTMLYGMGLEKYHKAFVGLDLKMFLQLTEDDLTRLGVDINAHREQYTKHLRKFHTKKWTVQSIGVINKSLPYTIYDGVVCLGTASKQIAVITASFQYIKKNLRYAISENINLTNKEALEYNEELKNVEETLGNLKKELLQIQYLAKKIKKENNMSTPAIFIGKEAYKTNWPMILGIAIIIGVYMLKRTCV